MDPAQQVLDTLSDFLVNLARSIQHAQADGTVTNFEKFAIGANAGSQLMPVVSAFMQLEGAGADDFIEALANRKLTFEV